MPNMPLVSIVILAYKNFELLFEAIDSVLEQDYPKIELIISDDASPDFNTQKLDDYLMKRSGENISQWSINKNKVNMGTVKHYNAAIARCTGEIIKLMAADDALYDSRVISDYVNRIQSNDLIMVTSQFEVFDHTLTISQGPGMGEEEIELLKTRSSKELYPFMAASKLKFSLGVCLTRTWFEKYGTFDAGYRIDDDWPTWLRAVRMGCPIAFMDRVTLRYRSGGISSDQNPHSRSNTIAYVEDIRRVWIQEIIPNRALIGSDQWQGMITEHYRRDEWPVLMANPTTQPNILVSAHD